mmetsp:Transcript_43413/g.82824  ORF Transcript_43413/g.82824 Transcript_43413/m.82824 type:complete len:295 (-) Transcript_43413:1500-2384(-)
MPQPRLRLGSGHHGFQILVRVHSHHQALPFLAAVHVIRQAGGAAADEAALIRGAGVVPLAGLRAIFLAAAMAISLQLALKCLHHLQLRFCIVRIALIFIVLHLLECTDVCLGLHIGAWVVLCFSVPYCTVAMYHILQVLVRFPGFVHEPNRLLARVAPVRAVHLPVKTRPLRSRPPTPDVSQQRLQIVAVGGGAQVAGQGAAPLQRPPRPSVYGGARPHQGARQSLAHVRVGVVRVFLPRLANAAHPLQPHCRKLRAPARRPRLLRRMGTCARPAARARVVVGGAQPPLRHLGV